MVITAKVWSPSSGVSVNDIDSNCEKEHVTDILTVVSFNGKDTQLR